MVRSTALISASIRVTSSAATLRFARSWLSISRRLVGAAMDVPPAASYHQILTASPPLARMPQDALGSPYSRRRVVAYPLLLHRAVRLGPLLAPQLEIVPTRVTFAAVSPTATGCASMLGVEPLGVAGVAGLLFLIMGCYRHQERQVLRRIRCQVLLPSTVPATVTLAELVILKAYPALAPGA